MAQTGQHTDVIFVVEGTALCGAYLHEIRSQYIIPTLEYFSGPIDEKDCGSDSNYCLYGLVTFHAADSLPGTLIETIGPLNTSFKLLCQIDRIKFNGGHGEAVSSVAEGLAAAMECLEDLADFRNTLTDSVAKKHIVLVCNCKPYGIPVGGSEGLGEEYLGKTVEQLATDMIEKEIQLSILSPRKIPSLIQLFDNAGGDAANQKGYSRDVRHLILLNGFSLKVNDDRPPSPARVNPETFSQSNTIPSSMHLSLTAQQLPPVMSNVQNPNPVSQQSPMMQHPRSPVSSSMTSSVMSLPQLSQQHSPMGGMQSPSANQMQQGNMNQLSQQQMIQLQQQQLHQQQQQIQQQQLFQQQPQQQPFRNPRPMTPPAGGQPPTRGAMMSPHQPMSQMTPQGGQPQQMNKLQHQQAFQQQQQQQAQMQNMAMQQQQNMLQNQNPNQQLNQIQMSMQQQQNIIQQNQLQSQQPQMMQQGQNLMQQQQQPQMSMMPGQNTMLQQQNIMQPGHNPMGQPSQVQMPMQPQQNPGQMQQGQIPGQQPGQGQPMSMSPGPNQRWSNQMNQQIQLGQQQTRMQTPAQVPPHPQPTSSPLQRPPQEIIARLNQPPMVGVGSPGAQNPNAAALGNIQQQLGSPTMQRERRAIWQGYLEWHEKQKGTPEGLKIPRQVPCHVSSTVVNNETEVKGDGWPSKLIMQLIPKQIVGNLGGTYFLDVKTVLFILQNCEALVSLTKVMDSGFAGCVHFTGSGMPQNACTIKVLILLYSKERNAYLGFIPNDQAGFVDRIRKVIQQQKTQQAAIRGTAPGIPPSIPQPFPGPGMQGGMVTQGQGQGQQQQQASPGLPVSVQQMSTQPQMMANPSQLQQQLGTASQMPSSHNAELERQQNALRIQQLKQELEQAEAQQRGLTYNQQMTTQGQMMSGQGQVGMASNPGGMNQGQMQQMSQGQMGQQGQGQPMRPGMPQRLPQAPGTQLNARLKHLLQQPGTNVGPGGAGFNRMRLPAQGQQNQMAPQAQQQQPQQQQQFHEDLGILDLLNNLEDED